MTQPLIPPSAVPSPYPAAGEVLDGKYQIERLLGEGGMGAVAKATHLLRRAPVALKFMSPAITSLSGAVDRFINEGVAASQIDSDHVVKIFDVGRLPTGAPYLVMEFMEGVDLSDLLMKEGTPGLPVARSIHFTLQILRGLQVAHAAGIVHRDMKPSNCFVVHKDGEPDYVKLLDFGISKVQQPGSASLTRTNSALGTPLYMSPEQARSPRDVDLRSDLYSVGVILYELLSGRTPFHSESGEFTEILYKIFTQDPPPIKTFRPELPDPLCDVIHRALAREASSRFGSAAEFGEALSPWADARSAHELSRLRTVASKMPSVLPPGHKPSIPVPPPQSIVPPSMNARASQAEATAKTMSEAGLAMPSIPAAPPPPAIVTGAGRTNAGVARDTIKAEAPPARKKAPVIPIAIAALLVGALGVGALMMRGGDSKGSASSVSQDPTSTKPAPPPPASALAPPPMPPLGPSSTASAEPSSQAPAPAPPPSPSIKAPAPRPQNAPAPAPKPAPRPGDLDSLTNKQ